MTLPARAQIAQAVVAELNGAPAGTFDAALWPAGGAVRSRDPLYDLTQLASTRVTVIATAVDETQATRASVRVETTVDIAVQRKIAAAPNTAEALAEGDALDEMVEAILAYLRRRKLSAMPVVAWQSSSNSPVYLPDLLREKRVYTSIVSVVYVHGEGG